MALMICPECGKQFSDETSACPAAPPLYDRQKITVVEIIGCFAAAVFFLSESRRVWMFTTGEIVGIQIIAYVFGGFCFTHLFYIIERKIERL